jgi:uncharacterized protein
LNEQQRWYHQGLRFRCTGCGQCCTGAPGYVWVNKAEIEALAAALGLEPAVFAIKYVRAVGIRYSLIEAADGDCVLLDKQSRRCKVYDVRPRQCRTWPFWESNLRTPQSWEEASQHCAGVNQGPLVPCRQILAHMAVVKV